MPGVEIRSVSTAALIPGRHRTPAIPELAELIEATKVDAAAFGGNPYPTGSLEMLALCGKLRAAYVDGAMAGYCLIVPNTPRESGVQTVEVMSLGVKPGYAGRGVGSALIADAINECEQDGFRILTLVVEPENRRAYELYLRSGFVKVGEDPEHYGEGEPRILMERPLTPSAARSAGAPAQVSSAPAVKPPSPPAVGRATRRRPR